MKKTKSHTNHGWNGKLLRVNLSDSEIREEELPEELMRDYIGGAGINAKLFYDLMRNNPQADPLSPDNPLIFGCGPLVGTTFPCATRYTVTAKSPLTRIFGDSNAGGYFGVRMKQAGYDHIVLQGKSDSPVALLIEEGKSPRLVDASELWGLDTYATDERIQKEYGKCETARIGPAGEFNLALHRNSIGLISRPLALPDPATGVRGAVANLNGIGVRTVITYDGVAQGHRVTVDLLAGVKTLDTDMGVTVLGS